jgi:uncharacterized protein (DUF433 family)
MAKEYVELKEGAYRVGGTRVLLDSVVYGFQSGASPECVQRSFPTLTLEQVHGAIAYYLGNKDKVGQYLIEGSREFEKLKRASREAYPGWYTKLERARKEIPDFLEDKTSFQADVNLNENIVTGVFRRVPEIGFQTALKAGLHGLIDSQVLDFAANQKRILVTQDCGTTAKHVEDSKRLRGNLGVLIFSQNSKIEPAIEELILIWKAFESSDHVNSILYLDL